MVCSRVMTQEQALTILKMGKNVFLTGAAGTGKTYVLNQYIAFLKEHAIEVAITASTGIAATHIGGQTIHAWAGIGIKDTLSEKDLDAMEQRQYLWKRFKNVKVLIIDEISMLHANTLDMVDRVCKTFKRNEEPFGGIQVVFAGDFFQLPPIEKNLPPHVPAQQSFSLDTDIVYDEMQSDVPLTPFVFTARSWHQAQLHICYLKKQFRQDEGSYISILNEIRSGEVDMQTIERLQARITKKEKADITKLYTHNMDVDRFNTKQLKTISATEKTYAMSSTGRANLVDNLKRGCLAPHQLAIKEGALVMFVKNNPIQGYVNGTVGEVVGFEGGYPIVRTKAGQTHVAKPQSWAIDDNGNVLAEVSQVPLKLAWAVTVHKSQGMTLDAAFMDLSQAFVPGQGYVALSRVRSLEGLFLGGINQRALEVHPMVLDFDRRLQDASEGYVSKLEKTPTERTQEITDAFVKRVGGKSKTSTKK